MKGGGGSVGVFERPGNLVVWGSYLVILMILFALSLCIFYSPVVFMNAVLNPTVSTLLLSPTLFIFFISSIYLSASLLLSTQPLRTTPQQFPRHLPHTK